MVDNNGTINKRVADGRWRGALLPTKGVSRGTQEQRD